MQPPKIDNSTKEEHQAYMLYAYCSEGRLNYKDIPLEIKSRPLR